MKKIYLFAVIFAIAAGFATYFFVNGLQHNSAVTGVEEANVVIALKDIDADTVVKPEMFTTIRLPVTSITYGALVDAADVYGYVATEKIFRGEQVLAARLTDVGLRNGGAEYNGEYRLSYHLQEGTYAYTLQIASTDALANFIRKGDYINVYMNDPAEEVPMFRNVEVLAIGTYSDMKMSTAGTETLSYDLITVILTEEQLNKVIMYDNILNGNAVFNIALVPYAEGAELTTLPEKTVTKSNGDTKTVPSAEEPQTNRGRGEIVTEPPTTEKNN